MTVSEVVSMLHYQFQKACHLHQVAVDNHNGELSTQSSQSILNITEAIVKLSNLHDTYEVGKEHGRKEVEAKS